MPTPQQCATAGCSYGTRYACCADPGPQPAPSAIFCSVDASKEDLPLFAFTKRDGETCTTVEMGLTSGKPPQITTPFGNGDALGLRGPCDSFSGLGAIGGVGSITLHPSSTGDGNHYDVHVALFFDTRTGIADVSRIDVDDIALTSCPATGCQPCMGACAFDATYRYGFVGGRVSWVDTAVIAPPAAYQHIRSPVTTMPADITCAPAPPACGGPAIDVGDVMAAFGDADVQDALARSKTAGTYPFYGQDPRPSDGQAFQLTRDGGGGFLIGGPCPPGSTASSCTEIPGGLSRLKSVLLAFDQQQLQADPTCAQLRP
jgi:hypothetical protein